MDPIVALDLLRQLAKKVDKENGQDADRALLLATTFLDLDEWLTKGGFSPWGTESAP